MDIKFNCANCGQHVAIDEAGAGLSIECPTCRAGLTVPPTAVLSSPGIGPLSSEQLMSRCRDLVYELRVEEAICALKEADKARAREKGYELNEAFCFRGTGQDVLETGKCAIAEALRNLTPKEEREVLGALVWLELSGPSLWKGRNELSPVVVGSNLRFPYFEAWLGRYKASLERPEIPAIQEGEYEESELQRLEYYESELTKPTEPELARMHELSLPARRLLFGRRIDITPDVLRDGGVQLEAGISELAAAGLARRCAPASPEEELERLSLNWLQSIQKKHGVKIPRAKKGAAPTNYQGRRERIIHHLIATIGTDKIVAELPPPPVFEVKQPESARYAFEEYRAAYLTRFLLFHGMRNQQRHLSYMAEIGITKVWVDSDGCAACHKGDGVEFPIAEAPKLPHPDCFCPDGCKCLFVPVGAVGREYTEEDDAND